MSRTVRTDETDVSVTIKIIDSADGTPETGVTAATSGLDLWYRKGVQGAKTSLTESNLSALTDAHSDGGMLHIGDGLYRVDLPDAAVPDSAGEATTVGGGATDMIVLGCELVGVTDLTAAEVNAEADTAISDAGLATGAALTTVDSVVDAIKAVTDNLPDSGALTSLLSSISSIFTATTMSMPSTLSDIEADTTAILEDTGTTIPDQITALNDPTAAAIADQVWTEAIADHSGTSGSTAEALDAAGGGVTAAAIADAVWDETMSDHTTSGSTGSKLNSITAGSVTYAGPVAPATGNVTVTIGDDYSNDDSRALEWTSSSWPNLTSAQSITLVVEDGTASDGTDWSITLTAPTAGAGSQTIRAQPTKEETELLVEGTKPFQIEAVLATSGNIVTLVEARWTSKDDIA